MYLCRREVQITPDDDVPVMRGRQHTVDIDSGDSVMAANFTKSGKKDAKKLREVWLCYRYET